jgi:hypothetical protein
MDKPDRGDPQAMDLGELLTVLQAADWTGLPVTAIRRRMEEGDLRFEVLRDKGRDVQRVRWVDLCDLYPEILEGPEKEESPSTGAQTAAPPPAAAPSEAPPSNGPAAGSSAQEARPAGPDAHDGERGLQLSVLSLTEQRDDLREQCYDLRVRLSSAEKERQAAVGALLHAQKQFLTVEGSSHASAPGPFWKRPRVWSMVAATGLVLWTISGMLDKQSESIAQHQVEWAQNLSAQTQERLQFQTQRIDSERRAMQDEWVRMNTLTQEERQAIRTKLDQDQTERAKLHQKVDSLEQNSLETQRIVQAGLDTERAQRERWSQEQLEWTGAQWEALRADSLGLLRSEFAAERARNLKQKEAQAAAWRQREEKALSESQRLTRQVGALVERMENGQKTQQMLTDRLVGSEARNAAFERNLDQDVGRFLGRWAAHWSFQMAAFRP